MSCFIEHACQFVFSTWKVVFATPEIQRKFYSSNKKICIAAHTTPFLDGMILHAAMIQLGITNHKFYVRGLFGCGPSWCKEISQGGGFLQNEIAVLKQEEKKEPEGEFCRIIFPSGGTVVWKSGFFVLAKELNADIVVVGIDYSTRRVVIDSIMDTTQFEFEMAVREATTRLRKYSAGPFWFPLRVLFGYGCETYPVWPVYLFAIRCLIPILYGVPMLDGIYTHSDVRICEHTGCVLIIAIFVFEIWDKK